MITIVKKVNGQLHELQSIEPGCWVNIYPPFDMAELDVLCHEYNIPTDFLNDSIDVEERARYEREDDNELVVITTSVKNPSTKEDDPFFVTGPIGIVSKPEFIITISAYKNPVIDTFLENRVKNFDPADQNLFALQLFDRNAYYFLKNLKDVYNLILHFEKKLYSSSRNLELTKLLNLQKCLVYFVTGLRNNEFMLTKLQRSDFLNISGSEEKKELFEDILIDNRQAHEMSSIYSDNLTNTLDTFGSIIGNNLNVVMRRLTAVTIILMVPTLITSFYGMNVNLPFSQSHFAYVIIVLLSLMIGGGLLLYFRRNKWM